MTDDDQLLTPGLAFFTRFERTVYADLVRIEAVLDALDPGAASITVGYPVGWKSFFEEDTLQRLTRIEAKGQALVAAAKALAKEMNVDRNILQKTIDAAKGAVSSPSPQHERTTMSPELTKVKASYENLKTAVASAETLLASLANLIRASKDDPAALSALADQIDADKAELANAVTANTI